MNEMPAFDPVARTPDHGNGAYSAPGAGAFPRRAPAMRANGLIGKAQNHLLELAESSKSDLVCNVDNLVGLIREVASQVESIGIEPLTHYARRTTALVDDLHGSIRDKSVEDLIDDGRELVRSNPEIAIVVAAIIGFVGARILKARP